MWNFLLAVLATWRVTHLLANEDGPADLIARFRALLGDSIPGRLMDCFYCLSVWIAAPAALVVARRPGQWILTWLALSGAACLLERIPDRPHHLHETHGVVEGDEENVLRFETCATKD